VKVLVFGDGWGAFGPGWQMLQSMFQRHGAAADVKSAAVAGTSACQWATNPNNLAAAGENSFPGTGPDFVWLTLGGNDLLGPTHQGCMRSASSFATAYLCALESAAATKSCNVQLLRSLYARFPRARVVQTGYDLPCSLGACYPSPSWPYCGSDVACANFLGKGWGEALLYPVEARFGGDRYTPLLLTGSVQQASNQTDGEPDLARGSPCELMVGCTHPLRGSRAAHHIGEMLWTQFFETRIRPSSSPEGAMRSMSVAEHHQEQEEDAHAPPGLDVLTHLEVQDASCNRDWVPNLEDPNGPPPPCNRT